MGANQQDYFQFKVYFNHRLFASSATIFTEWPPMPSCSGNVLNRQKILPSFQVIWIEPAKAGKNYPQAIKEISL
jgi:hypothetical protein